MNTPSTLIFAMFAGLHASALPAEEPPPGPLTVTVQGPVVTVERHPPGRYFLSLPTLEYAFEVETNCSNQATPASLSINVADSRVALSTAELDGKEPRRIVLTVPARQIAPIALNDFCVIDNGGADGEDSEIELGYAAAEPLEHPQRTTVNAALSAQVSLLCLGDQGRDITYLTQPLDVTLACAAAASTDPATETRDTTER